MVCVGNGTGGDCGVGGFFPDDMGVFGTDPARQWASSCQLRSGVSPVPQSEGPGAPSCGFYGLETEATRRKPWSINVLAVPVGLGPISNC